MFCSANRRITAQFLHLQRGFLSSATITTLFRPPFAIYGNGIAHPRALLYQHSVSLFSTETSASKEKILRNEEITFPTMRVVYKDPVTQENKWQILNRREAITFARSQQLDLVLVNGASDPPVCKLENYGQLLMSMKKKDKAKKATQKARAVKEIFIGAGIDPHDLGTKMNHVKEFLSNGHPVRIVVIAKKQNLKDNPLAVEEVTLKVLDSVEKFVSSAQQPTQTPMRSEFLLNPKSSKSNPKASPQASSSSSSSDTKTETKK